MMRNNLNVDLKDFRSYFNYVVTFFVIYNLLLWKCG